MGDTIIIGVGITITTGTTGGTITGIAGITTIGATTTGGIITDAIGSITIVDGWLRASGASHPYRDRNPTGSISAAPAVTAHSTTTNQGVTFHM